MKVTQSQLGERVLASPWEPRLPVSPAGASFEERPAISKGLLQVFSRYVRFYLRRHFHSVGVLKAFAPPSAQDRPLVVYSNHASWWDPLVALLVQESCFPGRDLYGAVDAAALRRYAFLSRIGLFGIEANSVRGARQFLRTAGAILNSSNSLLWLTPQGRFADARERPAGFRAGLGHLAVHCPHAVFLPVAVEYTFWQERLPEVLVAVGDPANRGEDGTVRRSPACWTELLEQRLVATQEVLARECRERDAAAFAPLLRGKAGVSGVYDAWRRAKAAFRGETFDAEHGSA